MAMQRSYQSSTLRVLFEKKLLIRLTNVESYHMKFYFHAHLEAVLLYVSATLNGSEQ